MGTAQLSISKGTPSGIPGQDKSGPVRTLQRWHVALCGATAALLKGSALDHELSGNRHAALYASNDRERAQFWVNLGERVSEYCAGVAGVAFTAGDVELVRWHRLVGSRMLGRGQSRESRSQTVAQLDQFAHSLWSVLPAVERARVAPEFHV